MTELIEVLSSIKELREGGQKKANWYLNHGYILLAVQNGTRAEKFPALDRSGHQYQYYVRRNPIYVVGRPEGVEEAPAPPWLKSKSKKELEDDDHTTESGQGRE